MPGAYDFLHPDLLCAGPRRVTLAPAEPVWSRRPYRLHDEPPPHVPPLPAAEPRASRERRASVPGFFPLAPPTDTQKGDS